MSAKDEFIKLFTENIHREGADKLLAWLESCDFFTAPASAKYHSNHEGGLCEHSLNVYHRLVKADDISMAKAGSSPTETPIYETLAICGLLHDVCKANFYKVSTRNVKNEETGAWEKQPYYAVDDQLPTVTAKSPFTL